MSTAAPAHLRTADGERLHAVLLPGPGATCVVLAHGFSGSLAKPAVRRVAAGLARHTSVLAYDARGHGRSTGRTTLGDREALDVDAAVALARSQGFSRVVTCGWSMGGSAVIRQAALRGTPVGGHVLSSPPDAVASVSGTAAWSTRATATTSMRRLHRLVETRTGRFVARRAMATRIDPATWAVPPPSPLDVVGRVAPLPLLVVHGERDGYFAVSHAQALAAEAGEPVELWIEPGFAHAESGATPTCWTGWARDCPHDHAALLGRGARRRRRAVRADLGYDAGRGAAVGPRDPGRPLRTGAVGVLVRRRR